MICSCCNNPKTNQDFSPRELARALRNGKARCKSCAKIDRAKYVEKNRDKINATRRAGGKLVNRHRNLNSLYGISLQDWNMMFQAQGMVCKICKTDNPLGRGWQTDHCHSTGKIRGVLCHSCNSLIGHAKENKEILTSAINYLEENK